MNTLGQRFVIDYIVVNRRHSTCEGQKSVEMFRENSDHYLVIVEIEITGRCKGN
jgi:endonuclease/exonuclease/phosphatase family metal-dependent hydrolase